MIKLYSNTGTLKLDIYENRSCKRTFKLMEEDSISLKFTKATSVFIEIGDYVDILEGGVSKRFVAIERFTPTRNTSNRGYDYDVKLEADYCVWKNKVMKYRPASSNAESEFGVTDSITVHARLLKANIDYLGTEYTIWLDPSLPSSMMSIQYSNISVYDGMIKIAETFKCEVWVEGTTVKFGYCSLSNTPIEFELGVNARDMSQDNPNGEYATRIYPFGGSTNIPYGYRKKLEFEIASVDSDNHNIVLNRPVTSSMFDGEKEFPSSQTVSLEAHSYEQIPSAGSGDVKNYNTAGAYWIDSATIIAGKYSISENVVTRIQALRKTSQEGVYEVRTANNIHGECTLYLIRVDSETGRGEFNIIETKKLEYASAQTLEFNFNSFIPEKTLNYDYIGIGISFGNVYETWEGSGNPNGNMLRFSVASGGTLLLGNTSFSVTTDTNIGEVVVNPMFYSDSAEESHIIHLNSWNNPLVGDKVVFDTPILSMIQSGWFSPEDSDSDVISTGVVSKNLMLPKISQPIIEDGIKRTSQYVQDASVSDEDVIEMVAIFDKVIPSFAVDDYTVSSIDVERQYEGTEDTYMFKQYILNIPSFNNFDTRFVIGDSLKARFIGNSRLSGMDFELFYMGSSNGNGQFAIQWNEDYGRELPDGNTYPSDDDPFVMLGVDTSFQATGAVDAAELKLVDDSVAYLKELLKNRKTYTVTPYASNSQILSPGTKVKLINDAFFETWFVSRVFGYEYVINKPSAGLDYYVGENSKYSKFKVLESKIEPSSMTGETYSAGVIGNQIVSIIKLTDDTDWTDQNVLSSARSRAEFLSKQHDDTMSGKLTVMEGLKSEKTIDADGNIHSKMSIEADGGVSSGGISDLSIIIGEGGGGGGGDVNAVRVGSGEPIEPDAHGVVNLPAYPSQLSELSGDSTHRTVTDEEKSEWNNNTTAITNLGNRVTNVESSVEQIEDFIDLSSLDEFDVTVDYVRGMTCKVTDGHGKIRGYRFVMDKEHGAWDGTYVERLNVKTLARPLNILSSDLQRIIAMN